MAYGGKFTLRTLRLKTLKNQVGQQAYWLARLDQYHYHLKHHPRRMHGNADSLSRRPCVPKYPHFSRRDNVEVQRRITERVETLDPETLWMEVQRDDPDISPVVVVDSKRRKMKKKNTMGRQCRHQP